MQVAAPAVRGTAQGVYGNLNWATVGQGSLPADDEETPRPSSVGGLIGAGAAVPSEERYVDRSLIGRVLQSRGMDFWESGMDLKHGDDIYDSFKTYQQKLLREYASMADEFHFRVVDARRPVDRIQDELRRQVSAFLEPSEKPAETITAH